MMKLENFMVTKTNYMQLTETRRKIKCSSKMETEMKKKQTVARAHVGVYSREVPALAAAMKPS